MEEAWGRLTKLRHQTAIRLSLRDFYVTEATTLLHQQTGAASKENQIFRHTEHFLDLTT
jgi:hypothetical protein